MPGKKIASLVAITFLALFLGCRAEPEGFFVTKVIDGDTIQVQSTTGARYKVRYIGIDAPETSQQSECYGPEATAKNRELVERKKVELQKDVSETDRYGRLLRYVLVDSLFVNAEMVEKGYARAVTYPPDVRYRDLFARLEREARQAKAGIWGPECSGPPRRSSP